MYQEVLGAIGRVHRVARLGVTPSLAHPAALCRKKRLERNPVGLNHWRKTKRNFEMEFQRKWIKIDREFQHVAIPVIRRYSDT